MLDPTVFKLEFRSRRVVYPIAWHDLTFSRSLGEFGATITFVGNIAGETRTLPLGIYGATHTPVREAPLSDHDPSIYLLGQ